MRGHTGAIVRVTKVQRPKARQKGPFIMVSMDGQQPTGGRGGRSRSGDSNGVGGAATLKVGGMGGHFSDDGLTEGLERTS